MSHWLSSLSPEDKAEMVEDLCQKLQEDLISVKEFQEQMGRLGFNATDIEEEVRRNAPHP
jgi:hypothetical protein